jgi:hypothetical protein
LPGKAPPGGKEAPIDPPTTAIERTVQDYVRRGGIPWGSTVCLIKFSLTCMILRVTLLYCSWNPQIMAEEIGRGGYGAVFKAWNQRTGELVAIKRLHIRHVEENASSIQVRSSNGRGSCT